jgi:pimeloyl-ACP methyl ester carboxylesterase
LGALWPGSGGGWLDAAELPVLCDLLPQIDAPVEIIAGARDAVVPPVNAEFLHQRLPHSRLDVIDAGHSPRH